MGSGVEQVLDGVAATTQANVVRWNNKSLMLKRQYRNTQLIESREKGEYVERGLEESGLKKGSRVTVQVTYCQEGSRYLYIICSPDNQAESPLRPPRIMKLAGRDPSHDEPSLAFPAIRLN